MSERIKISSFATRYAAPETGFKVAILEVNINVTQLHEGYDHKTQGRRLAPLLVLMELFVD